MKKTMSTVLGVAFLALPATVWADDAPPYEAHPELGYLGCFDTEPTVWGTSLDDAMRIAEARGARGFLYWPENEFTATMIGEYPSDCTSSPDPGWNVYLATDAMIFYEKARYGVTACDLDVIQDITNTDMTDSFEAARKFGAVGFVIDHLNATSQLLASLPDGSCSGPTDPAHELFVAE